MRIRTPARTEIDGYPAIWLKMTRQWSDPHGDDRAWLIYSANYLFRTAGVHWALDPIRLRSRLPTAKEINPSTLSILDCVVLTHRHKDHLDLEFLSSIKHLHMKWILPEDLLGSMQILGIPERSLVVAHPGDNIQIGGLSLTAFEGQHWEVSPDHMSGRKGVPEIGFLLEFGSKRWLIPGDTRTYDARNLPDFGEVDGLIVHLWLGRGQAMKNYAVMLDSFGRFCLDLHPRQIVITHLYEWGRPATDLWDEKHAREVIRWFRSHASALFVTYRLMGDSFSL